MKLKTVKIKGWRSFSDTEGIELGPFKKMNLLIGKNNTGKSNLFKYFQNIVTVFFETNIEAGSLSLTSFVNGTHQGPFIKETDFWSLTDERISAEVVVEDVPQPLLIHPRNSTETTAINFHKFAANEIAFEIVHQKEDRAYSNSNVWWNIWILPFHPDKNGKPDGLPMIEKKGNQNRILDIKKPFETSYKELQEKEPLAIAAAGATYHFTRSFIFVDPIRHLDRERKAAEKVVFDGGKLILHMAEWKKKNTKNKWVQFEEQIIQWISDLINEEIFSFEPISETIQLKIKRGGNKIRHDIDEFGTGVSQMTMLLSHLWWNRDKQYNVFLDEPENNLHPEAVARIIRILEGEEFSNHRFFISSHSSALMDLVNDDWTVYRTIFSPERGTRFEEMKNVVQHYELLDDLGVRASQILQTNLVIWVEGPSDRIYIKKWLELAFPQQFREGKHFSFIFFGGANLAHFDFDRDGIQAEGQGENVDYTDMFFTSRYSIIVHDSDKKSEIDRSKPHVQRLRNKLAAKPELADRVMIWETDGKEIENYVPDELWAMISAQPQLQKKKIQEANGFVQLSLKEILGRPDQFQDFKEFLRKFYGSGNGAPISDSDAKKIDTFHSGLKVELAKFFTNHWTEDMVKDPQAEIGKGLHSQLKKVMDLIQVANGMQDL